MAEGVFAHLVASAGAGALFEVESAGTVCYQSGSCPDERAIRAAGRHGIDISSIRARCIHDLDLEQFDRIFVMDFENHRDLHDALEGRPVSLHMMTEFATSEAGAEIEDPYYGDEAGFDRTLLRLMESATGILAAMRVECGFPDQESISASAIDGQDDGDER